MSKKDIKQSMRLIESILSEARHDDIFDNHYNRINKALEELGVDDEQVLRRIVGFNNYYDEVKAKVTFKSFNPMWKVFFGEYVALQMLRNFVQYVERNHKEYRVGKDKQHIAKIEAKNVDFKDIRMTSSDLLSTLEHYSGINYQQLQEVNPYNTNGSFLEELKSLEEDYIERNEGGTLFHTGEEKLLVKVGDLAWYNTGKSFCEDEGDAMNHCGNEVGKFRTSDRILSLRSHVSGNVYKPHLTFILDSNGFLGEMKGRANSKPSSKYHEAIIELIKLDIINGIKGGGWIAENNFKLEDLSDAHMEELRKAKGEEWFDAQSIMENPMNVLKLKNPSDAVQAMAVEKNFKVLSELLDSGVKPTERVWLAGLRHDGSLLRLIDNPTEDMKEVAIRTSEEALKYIENPSEELQLKAVTSIPESIQYIDNPSLEVQLTAVKRNGYVIEYLYGNGIEVSEEVQMTALAQNNRSIQVIENPTEKVQLEAIRKGKYNFYDIENPTEKAEQLFNELWKK